MALASLFGGLALTTAGLGLVHALASPIGGRFSAPHGAVCGALLCAAMKTNLRAVVEDSTREPPIACHTTYERFAEVAQILTNNRRANADAGVEWVEQLVGKLEIPRLSAYGIAASDALDLAASALNSNSMRANPVQLTAAECAAAVTASL
jgi:alcohol dehydrogenase class IV